MAAPDETLGHWKTVGKWQTWVPNLRAVAERGRERALTAWPGADGVLWVVVGGKENEVEEEE